MTFRVPYSALMTSIVVSATVVTENEAHATKAAEVLARAAAGLVLDGINVSVSLVIPEDADDTP